MESGQTNWLITRPDPDEYKSIYILQIPRKLNLKTCLPCGDDQESRLEAVAGGGAIKLGNCTDTETKAIAWMQCII